MKGNREALKLLRANVILALAYLALGQLVHLFFTVPSPVWLATGVSVFAAMAGGWRWMPGIAIGAFLANLGFGFVGAVMGMVGNVVGPLVGLAVFRRLSPETVRPFTTPRSVGAFFAAMALLNGVVSALFGATGLFFVDGHRTYAFLPTFLNWTTSDTASAIMLAPAMYLWKEQPRVTRPSRGGSEVLLAAALLTGIAVFFFIVAPGAVLPPQDSILLLLLPLTWIALRFSQRDAYTLLAMTFLVMLAGTMTHTSVFQSPHAYLPFANLQLQIALMGAMVLLAGALDLDRREAIRALEEVNASLEQRIHDRTRMIEAIYHRFQTIVESFPNPMIMSEAENGKIVEVNDAAAANIGASRSQLIGQDVRTFCLFPDECNALLQKMRSEGAVQGVPIPIRHTQGATLFLLVSAAMINDGMRDLVLISFQDVTQAKMREHELEIRVNTDGLTGAATHEFFLREGERLLCDARENNASLALLMLDLDHFKRVNDTYGHQAGDEVLRQVGISVRGTLRTGDLFGRLGGEEFGILLVDMEEGRARRVTERLRQVIGAVRVEVGPQTVIQPTVSIGAAMIGKNADKEMTLVDQLDRADRALYSAKHAGRNRVMFWSPASEI